MPFIFASLWDHKKALKVLWDKVNQKQSLQKKIKELSNSKCWHRTLGKKVNWKELQICGQHSVNGENLHHMA